MKKLLILTTLFSLRGFSYILANPIDTKLYGSANYYAIDPFHEGGSTEGVNLKDMCDKFHKSVNYSPALSFLLFSFFPIIMLRM